MSADRCLDESFHPQPHDFFDEGAGTAAAVTALADDFSLSARAAVAAAAAFTVTEALVETFSVRFTLEAVVDGTADGTDELEADVMMDAVVP
jgi:hypothetical protein